MGLQGGGHEAIVVAARLYDTVGPKQLATIEPDQFQSTLEQHVSFLRPVRPGQVSAHGRIVHRVGDTVFLEASLTNGDGELAATSAATAQVIRLMVGAKVMAAAALVHSLQPAHRPGASDGSRRRGQRS